jgi:hypothetical protein
MGDTLTFGNIVVGQSSDVTLTVRNNGTVPLELTGSPLVRLEDPNAPPQFSITQQPASSSLQPDASTTFALQFSPTGTGTKEAKIFVENNDADEGSYYLNLKGIGFVETPEISLAKDTSEIQDGGSYDFSAVTPVTIELGREETFTISNLGGNELILSGTPAVSISGADASLFSITEQPSTPIGIGSSSTFTIRFLPLVVGNYTAEVSIPNNDPSEGDFRFTATGQAVAPEISVFYGQEEVTSGDMTPIDGGSIRLFFTKTLNFRVYNTFGDGSLQFTGSPDKVTFEGADAGLFSVAQLPTLPIPAGQSGALNFLFAPDTEGMKSVDVSIPTNDPDEDPFLFRISATALPAAPDIGVQQDTNPIFAGDTFDFGAVELGGKKSLDFLIFNWGWADLLLDGIPPVAISGSDASDYIVLEQPDALVEGRFGYVHGTGFSIRFDPNSTGTKTATATIPNNDPDPAKSPFVFTITGTCTAPPHSSVTGQITLPFDLTEDRSCIVAVEPAHTMNPQKYRNILLSAAGTNFDYDYEVFNVPDGDTYLWACVDVNGNGVYHDPMDYLGFCGAASPLELPDDPNISISPGSRSGFDFLVAERQQQAPILDSAGDASFDYIDIASATISIDSTSISCSITVQGIPDQLVLDRSDTPPNYLEYRWAVYFDVDNNGIDGGDFRFGITSAKIAGDDEKLVDRAQILSYTEKTVAKKPGDAYWSDICDLDVTLSGDDTFIMEVLKSAHADLSAITETSTIYIDTFTYNGGVHEDTWP